MTRRLTRRDLLLGTSALAVAACAPAKGPPGGAKTPIVIVGAGLAGLVVARELAAAGREVVVLEAQKRPGGRILTLRSPLPDGLYVECGAIHVIGDPELLALLRAVDVEVVKPKAPRGLATIEHFDGKRTRYEPGVEPPSRAVYSEAEKKLDFAGRLERTFALVKGVDPQAPLAAFAKYDGTSALELLTTLGASPGWATTIAQSFVPERLDRESAGFLLQQMAGFFRDSTLTGGGRIEGGSDRLPFALAKALGERIVYGAEVKRIEQNEDGARVSFTSDGVLHQLDAVRVVSAIPYSVLRTVELVPAVREAKARAIRELPMASVARVFSGVDRRFWLDAGESADAETDLPFGSVRDETKLQAGEGGVLGAYLSGDAARRYTQIAKDARAAAFLEHLERVHPGAKAHAGAFAEHAWDEDPFARGAYAWLEKGQLASIGPLLAAREGRLHFAGDHTSTRPGWMHGAIASAKRVVGELLALLP